MNKLSITVLIIVAAELALFAAGHWLPGNIFQQLDAAIRSETPSFLQGLRISFLVPIVIVPVVFKLFLPMIDAIKSAKFIYPRFDEKTLRPIRRAQAFDPLRGTVFSPAGDGDSRNRIEPMPFDKAGIEEKGNEARKKIWDALSDLAKPSPNRAELKRLERSDFLWTVVVGTSGIGKSRLVMEFGRHLARRDLLGGDNPSMAYRVLCVIRTLLRLNSIKYAWDAGWIENQGSEKDGLLKRRLNILDRLSVWQPRKPTFLLLDDPLPDDAIAVVQRLVSSAAAGRFKFPVRLVIVGPSLPAELEFSSRDDISDDNWQTPFSHFSGTPIIVSEATGFDVGDFYRLLKAPNFGWLRPAVLDLSPTNWGDRLTASIQQILIQVEGNPFLLESFLAEIKMNVEKATLDKRRLLRLRADNLLRALETSGLKRADFPLLAAAALAQGTGELSSESRRLLSQYFPALSLPNEAAVTVLRRIAPAQTQDGARRKNLDHSLPAVRPRILGMEFVRALLEEVYDQEETAKTIVAAAWRASPISMLHVHVQIKDQMAPANDLLSRLLSEPPPPDAGLSKLEIATAYVRGAVVIDRASWERGVTYSADQLYRGSLAAIEALSPLEAIELITSLKELSNVTRLKEVIHGLNAIGILVAATRKISEAIKSDAFDKSSIVASFAHIYNVLANIAVEWGGIASDRQTTELVVALRELKSLAPSSEIEIFLTDKFIEAAVNGRWNNVTLFLAHLSAFDLNINMGSYVDPPKMTPFFALVHCARLTRIQYERLSRGTPPAPSKAVLTYANQTFSSIPQTRCDVIVWIACLACADQDRSAALLQRALLYIDTICADDDRSPLRLMALRISMLAHMSPDLLKAAEDEIDRCYEGASDATIRAAVNLDEILQRMRGKKSRAETANIKFGFSSFALKNLGISSDCCETAFLGLRHAVNLFSDEAKIEDHRYRKAWDDARGLAIACADRWIGHFGAEAQFSQLIAGYSRASRSSPDITRNFAREIEFRLRPMSGSSEVTSAILEGWRLHAFSLSHNYSASTLAELIDVVAHADKIVADSTGVPAIYVQHVLCREYLVRTLVYLSRSCVDVVNEQFEKLDGRYLDLKIVRALIGMLEFASLSRADSLPFRTSAGFHRWMFRVLIGENAIRPRVGGHDDQFEPECQLLNRHLVRIACSLVEIEAPGNPAAARFIVEHIESTIAFGRLGDDPQCIQWLEDARSHLPATDPLVASVFSYGVFLSEQAKSTNAEFLKPSISNVTLGTVSSTDSSLKSGFP